MKSVWVIGNVSACVLTVLVMIWRPHDGQTTEIALAALIPNESASAAENDAKAQFNLGAKYYYGKGVPQDYAEALRLYRKSAEQGLAKAQDALGYMYLTGQGVPQDYAEALRWYEKAAEQGDAKAQFDLGSMYYYGNGVRQDYVEADRWCRKAAEQNYAKAQDVLGSMYYNGLGVRQDYSEAFIWYRRAAEQGYAKGQSDLASMYYYGAGTAQSYTDARRWYLQAAKQGDAEAQQALALFAESHTITKIEYLELLLSLPYAFWVLLDFVLRRRKHLDLRNAARLLLGLVFLTIAGMNLYVILHGGLMYCAYPAAFRIVKRALIGTGVLIIVTVVLPTKKKPNVPGGVTVKM